MVLLIMFDRPVTLPRLAWDGPWTVLIQTMIKVVMQIVRDCGKNAQVIQIPLQFGLHIATDVKNTARIETQRLIVTLLGVMDPWIPSKATAFKSATAEFWDDPCQSHVEIASHDLNVKSSDLFGQSIPEIFVFIFSLHLHGPTMALHTHAINRFS